MSEILLDFKPWLLFYGRFIDDGIGFWNTNFPGAHRAWCNFQQQINRWSKLQWTNTGLVRSLQFLDLTVYINEENRLNFCTYRKPMNLNIYILPNSAHPPSVIKSIVFGRV